nr:MAG TPA: hypothetical protein [Caudoviricetes sp.]
MTKLINKNKLDVFTNKLWKRITKSFVSKTLHNNVSGETIFSNGHVEGSILRLFSNKNPNMLIGRGGSCFGVPSTSINAGMNVGKIAMAVDPSLEVGSTVSNVVALAVKKSNNTVKEVIVGNETATVYYNNNANLNAQKIIYININRSFNEEVYFLIGCDKMLWATDTPPISNAFGGPVPAVGTRLEIADYHYSGRFIIFSSRTSFEQLVGICNDSVSKTKNNILSGKTILQDAYISGDIYSIDNSNATDNSSANSDTKYSGTANKVITANTNVTSIVVAVRSSMNVGTVATGINVGVVRSDTNEIIEYVHQNSTGIVYENTYSQINASRIVNIPINKSWDQNIYFIIGVNGMLWNSPHGSLNLNRVTGGDSLPSVGHVINNLNTTNYIGKIVVLGEGISLNTLNNKVDISQVGNAANKIPVVGDNGKLPSNILPAEVNGGVRTVNRISPVDGNVTVLSSDIKYVNGQETTVKDAIDGKPNTVNGQSVNRRDGNITVYSDNIPISGSNPKKINEALNEKLNKSEVSNSGNNVPRLENGKLVYSILPDTVVRTDKENVFRTYCPKVRRTFTMASFNVEDSGSRTFEVFRNEVGLIKYICNYSAKFDNRTTVTHLIVPIKNAVVGDVVSATYFVINNDNRVIRIPRGHANCTVEDIDMLGCKCIRIPVNEAFNQRVGFGISVVSKYVNGRNIGMAYANDSRYDSSVWVGDTPENNKVMTTTNRNYVFPFKVGHETTSELITRFELEKVANIYPRIIGEYRSLSYDAGDTLEENGNVWLKANGQSISKEDYPDLYEKMNTKQATKNLSIEGNIDENTEIVLPNVENTIGYYYICAK